MQTAVRKLLKLMPKKQDVKEHVKDIDAIVNQKVKAELEKIREEEKVKKQKIEELKKAAKNIKRIWKEYRRHSSIRLIIWQIN